MRINEDYLDNIDNIELIDTTDEIDTQKITEADFPIHFIFVVTMPGKYRADALKKIINICRNKIDMFFDGDYALFYQENQRSEMKPLLKTTEITEQSGLKLCLNGQFNSLRHLWRFLFICYGCGIDRMYFLQPDFEQIQFFYMRAAYAFYERPKSFRFLDNKNFFDAMVRLINMLWPNDKQRQVDKFCSILQFDRYKKYLCNDMIPYSFLGHLDNNIDIPIDDKLRQMIESVDLDIKYLLNRKDDYYFVFSNMIDPSNQFLESELARRSEVLDLQKPVHLSHVRLLYHPISDWIKEPILFLFGYLGIYHSEIRSKRLEPVYMDVCLAFKGKCDFLDEGIVNPDSEFIKRCKQIFGGAVTKEIANTFWFWFENPALED